MIAKNIQTEEKLRNTSSVNFIIHDKIFIGTSIYKYYIHIYILILESKFNFSLFTEYQLFSTEAMPWNTKYTDILCVFFSQKQSLLNLTCLRISVL